MPISFKSITVSPFKIHPICLERYLLCVSSLSIKGCISLLILMYYLTWNPLPPSAIQFRTLQTFLILLFPGRTLFWLQMAGVACVVISGNLKHKYPVWWSSMAICFLGRHRGDRGTKTQKGSPGCRGPDLFAMSARILPCWQLCSRVFCPSL